MTEDSGTPPQQPEDESGYRERKDAEDAAAAPPPGPQFNPQSGFPAGEQPAAPPPYPTPGAPNPYAAPQYGQPYYPPPVGQPGWSQQPGMPAYSTYALPDNPKATAALVVGLVSVIGAFTCVLPVLAAPVAWVLGAQARREIRNAPQRWGGASRATAGMVLGIIGSALIVLAVIAVIVVIVLVASSNPTSVDYGTSV